MKRILLAAAALAMLAGTPALAQNGGGYGGGYGGGGYGRGWDDDDRPRRRGWERRGYDEGYGRPRMGSICVTARGNCRTRPAPLNTPCGCEVPGFGFKRGAIGG